MTTIQRWLDAVCADLGIEPGLADTRTILDLARDVAHQVDRPAAPLTAYLLGIAVGRGQPLGTTAERLTALAGGWPAPAADPGWPAHGRVRPARHFSRYPKRWAPGCTPAGPFPACAARVPLTPA